MNYRQHPDYQRALAREGRAWAEWEDAFRGQARDTDLDALSERHDKTVGELERVHARLEAVGEDS